MLISLILPTFNSISFLPKAFGSILTQNFKDFEIIIVDNVSTDGTIQWIEKYRENEGRIQLHSAKDNGIYDAMNIGIAYASGDWLYFMGADDSLFDENVLAKMSVHLNEKNDIVYGDSVWLPEKIKEAGDWNYATFIKANINHQRIFYRKAVFEKYGSLNTKYKIASDHEMNIRFFCNEQIHKKYIPVTVCNFHSGGFSANKTDEVFWADWDEIILKNFKPYLPKKIIYGSLGTYIRHLADKKDYVRAVALLWKHFYHTHSLGFVKLMLNYFGSPKTNYAG